MFQSFVATTTPATGAARLAALRTVLAEEGLAGFLVPRADAHQGETVAPRDERLAWLTGFTGSAGTAVVLAEEAAVFADGRYTLQVGDQIDTTAYSPVASHKVKVADWLAERLGEGDVLGYDPWLHGAEEIARLGERLADCGATLRPIPNPIDRIWEDQPAPPQAPIVPYPEALAGKSAAEKRADLAADLREEGIAAAVLTLPDSIAWLLNIRGSDVERRPIPLVFALLHADGTVTLIADPAKIGEEPADHLGPEVSVVPPDVFGATLDALSGPVAVDKASAPIWVSDRLKDAGIDVVWRQDPCILPKASKTEAEIAGAREAHLRDGAAMVEFLAWLDQAAPSGTLTEISVVQQLEAFRRATNALRDLSFDTICGAGPDGAIVHYRVTEATDRPVTPGDILLVDSGGQYLDGTTDITRTVATGPAPEDAIRAFTLVLKGMIAISRARWPEGLAGRDLDALARINLWQAGFDYDHGTGHGVGAYLGTHEGPQSLSRRGEVALAPGMILSNEPGYYREGAFGIRIENLIVVTSPEVPPLGDRPMLGFETLTYVPIDRRLIDTALLTAEERIWLDAYHAETRARLSSRLSDDAADWLAQATEPL
ncbi:MAG: aminopeptidase P family protein [Pseudomonadota bacterium]